MYDLELTRCRTPSLVVGSTRAMRTSSSGSKCVRNAGVSYMAFHAMCRYCGAPSSYGSYASRTCATHAAAPRSSRFHSSASTPPGRSAAAMRASALS